MFLKYIVCIHLILKINKRIYNSTAMKVKIPPRCWRTRAGRGTDKLWTVNQYPYFTTLFYGKKGVFLL